MEYLQLYKGSNPVTVYGATYGAWDIEAASTRMLEIWMLLLA